MTQNFKGASVYAIETANQPLVFRVKAQAQATNSLDQKVEVRSLPGMQKEAIVSSAQSGTWRLVSDEGPYLDGTDLAPFPLAFYSAGLQFCLMSQLLQNAKAQHIELKALKLDLDSRYTMKGSFLRGDALGGALPAEVHVELESDASAPAVKMLLNSALACSPAHAVMRDVLNNTFSLQLNGQPVALSELQPSKLSPDPDPQATTFQSFASDEQTSFLSDIISKTQAAKKVQDVAGGVSSSLQPVQDRTLHVRGHARTLDGTLKQSEVQLLSPIGSAFRFLSEDHNDTQPNRAPSGLAYLSAGVGFCYMTQLSRYAHIAKLKVDSIRIVQHNAFSLTGSRADGSARAGAAPVNTQVFIEADEPAEAIDNLVRVGERTCFLHAAMRASYPSRVRATLNGEALAL